MLAANQPERGLLTEEEERTLEEMTAEEVRVLRHPGGWGGGEARTLEELRAKEVRVLLGTQAGGGRRGH